MQSKRALVIDDGEQNLVALCELLQTWGYKVDGAASGEHALRVFVDRPPDIAVVDLSLHDCDVFDLIHILKKRGTRVIVYSGWHELERQSLAAGADIFVLKPDIA